MSAHAIVKAAGEEPLFRAVDAIRGSDRSPIGQLDHHSSPNDGLRLEAAEAWVERIGR